MDLIYCAGGNPVLSEIAYEEGYGLGMRSDASWSRYKHNPVFIDINYKKPDFEKHLEIVAAYRPKYATVPDLSETEIAHNDIDRALQQVERIAPYCQIPLVVPKLPGQIALLPPHIAIGYSIPSSYGGAKFPIWELEGRRIHLLGGSPKKQMQAYLHLSAIAEVVSADGNYAQLMATRYAQYWTPGHRWPKHTGVANKEKDIYFECWRLSCRNLRKAWSSLATLEEQTA